MSQNVTLSPTDLQDIAKIKPLLLQHKNQTQIAIIIGKRRETVNRKLARWMQTNDFFLWANTLWLEQYGEMSVEDKKEAFRQLTKLLISKQTRKIEARTEIEQTVTKTETININVYDDDEKSILDKAARLLDRKSKDEPESIH